MFSGPRVEHVGEVSVVHRIGGEQRDIVVVAEVVGMWSGSVSVSCPHAHDHGGVQWVRLACFRVRGRVVSASLVTALAVGFLFASGAAILSGASELELGEGLFADRTDAQNGGLMECVIEFGQ